MPSYKSRAEKIEIMDNLLCDGEVVHQTLRELEVINRLLGGNHVTIKGIKKLTAGYEGKPISIADLGCGGGDILKLIAMWGERNNYNLELTGIDANPNIITFAKTHSSNYPTIRYEVINVFSNQFTTLTFDIVVATLFMHHFTDKELVKLLNGLIRKTRIGIVINDIHRHWFAYHSIRLITKFFSKSTMVKFDAPLSVLRAFKKKELVGILERAEIKNYSLQWKWAFRWQLVIRS